MMIKKAKREDTSIILEMIKGLAMYEKLLDQVTASIDILEKNLFDQENAHVILAYEENKAVGFALYFYHFSTFKGKKGLYLEDLFVLPEFRSKGIGNQMFSYLINQAKKEHCGRMEWMCLDWNEPAKAFYKKKKATPVNGWTLFRLDESEF